MAMLGRGCRILPALAVAAAVLAASPGAGAADKVGVNSAVNPDAQGTPPGGQARRLVLGQDVVHNEHIVTDTAGQTQILFVDGSSMAVGPNSDLTIDEFVYDPSGGKGKLAMSAARGVLRYVGGELSKQEDAVSLRTPSATIGIRGAIFIATIGPNGVLDVTFVYGKRMTVSGGGVTRVLTRTGFTVHIGGLGAAPSEPFLATDKSIGTVLTALSGRTGATGGTPNPPTDAQVANSGISQTVSGNLITRLLNLQQQNQQTNTVRQAQNGLNTIGSQTQPTIVDGAESPPDQGTPINTGNNQTNNNNNNNQSNNNNQGNNNNNNNNPPPPTPVVVTVAGLAKSTNGPATAQGFIDQSSAGRIPYSQATITYPGGTPQQNGVFAFTANGLTRTLSPLTAGATTQVSNADGSAAGTATMTADGNFFYANVTKAATGQREFIYGGVPVSQGFYAPTATNQTYAFAVQPDAALATNTRAQTIPFLPSFAGGTMPNATVSPLYVTAPANTQFGAFNANSNPNALSPRWLQASLAINGQGTDQSSALAVSVGTFQTDNSGNVVGNGQVRGTVMTGAQQPVVSVASQTATVPDGNGNNLFGGNTISGFVLDQNDASSGSLQQANAQVSSVRPAPVTTTTPYAFNQPVTTTALPANVGVNRTGQNVTGFFGGVMQTPSAPNFAVNGLTHVVTTPDSGTVRATFVGQDPFTATQSGVDAINLNFGSTHPTDGRSAYIDNNNYGAVENANLAAAVVTGGNTTVFNQAPLAMVTSATVPNTTLFPAGVAPCQCQFLQWGYWTGSLQTGTPTSPAVNYAGQVNTWVAGQPTVTMPTTGQGTFTGAAIGTVANNGANYMAAGGFANTYNFGTMQGSVAITNFDNKNFTGTVNGVSGQPVYAGTLSGSGTTGVVNGGFFGPNAAETGGNFAVQAISGGPASYVASGIFAGARH